MTNNIVKYILIDAYVSLLFFLSILPAIGFFRYVPEAYSLNLILGVAWLAFFIFYLSKKLNTFDAKLIKDNNLDLNKRISFVIYFFLIACIVYFLVNKLYSFSVIISLIVLIVIIRDCKRIKKPPVGDTIEIS